MIKNIKFTLLFIFLASSVFAGNKYKISDLGTLNIDRNDEAVLINDYCEICIKSEVSAPTPWFLFWSEETGLKYILFHSNSILLNNLGQVIGYGPRDDFPNQHDIFILDPKTNVKKFFGFRDHPKNQPKLLSFNDIGQIIFERGGLYVFDNGEIRELNNFTADSRNHKITINNKSELLGTGKSDYGYLIAKYYPMDSDVTYDINPSMKKNFYGMDINNLGQCIIYWKSAAEEGAFLWPLGKAIPANSRKINDKGQILAGDTTLIEPNGEVIEINKVLDLVHDQSTPFEKIEYIHDINNNGQMVGRGVVNGKRHAVLISPRY
jgi:hypothetical protein